MAQTAALLKPAQKVLDAMKAFAVKVDAEDTRISDYPLKATLIAEAMKKWGVTASVLAETLGKPIEVVNAYLAQQIDPALTVDFHGRPYREIDRAKVERQIRLVKQTANVTFSGGMDQDWYAHDMSQKLAIRGVSDLMQFAAKDNEITLPAGSPVIATGATFVYRLVTGSSEAGDVYDEYPIDASKVQTVKQGKDENGDQLPDAYQLSQPVTINPPDIQYCYSTVTGEKFPIGGHTWESAFEGKGGVYYQVKFTETGLPIFYTQWFSTNDLAAVLPVLAVVAMAFGVPAMLGESILGAVGVSASPAVAGAVGNIAINTAITGGDVTHAVASAAASFAGGTIGGQIGETFDSVAIGQAASVATTAAIQGKQVNAMSLAMALGTTGTAKMDDTVDPFSGTGDYVYDPNAVDTSVLPDVAYQGDITFDDIGLDPSTAVDIADSLDAGEVAIDTAFNVDDLGNVYDLTGDMTAMSADAYLASFYPDVEGIKDGYNNVVIGADRIQGMTDQQIAAELQSYTAAHAGQEVNTADRTENTPAANPSVAKTAKMPSIADQASTWDKILKTAVSIGASVKAITSGTFRATYPTSIYGSPRAAVGVPVQRADGSVVTNNGNGTQTIQYPDGRVQTVSTNYTGSGVFGGMFGGINTQTLLIGGAVLLGAVLLARRK